jgi:release factor glutamine methyltransferase
MTEGPSTTVDASAIGGSDGTVPWRALMEGTASAFAVHGILSAEAEARRILEEATGYDGAALFAHLDEPATVRGVAAIDRMVERRLEGEPLQYVLGRWAFRGLDLMVDPRVLIPRPETEGLVDHALAELDRLAATRRDASPVVVDLGAGSGAIGLAVAGERRGTEVHAVDCEPGAVQVTRANLAGLGMAGSSVVVHEGSWYAALPPALAGRVGVVVSNPPYVAAGDDLPVEVSRWEPAAALIAGPTGLEAVEVVVAEAPAWLMPGGAVVVEIGESQGADACALALRAGFAEVEIRPDLAGRDRALVARECAPA